MATNKVMGGNNAPIVNLAVALTHPAAPVSGNPALWDTIPCFCLGDAGSDGLTVVDLGPSVYATSVAGIDSSGSAGADANVTVVHGDKLYYDETKTPPISKRAGGTYFGRAYAKNDGTRSGNLIAAGATATIRVLVGK